jgi:hypothetical protein
MSASIYTEKMVMPDNKMLSYDLADSKMFLDEIAEVIKTNYGDFSTEWKFYNQKSGWILKMYTKKRNVLFVIPCNQHFRVVFTFGDKAFEQIMKSSVPDSIKKDLSEANTYAEGRSIQVEVKTAEDLKHVLEMIMIKLS